MLHSQTRPDKRLSDDSSTTRARYCTSVKYFQVLISECSEHLPYHFELNATKQKREIKDIPEVNNAFKSPWRSSIRGEESRVRLNTGDGTELSGNFVLRRLWRPIKTSL